MRGIGVVKSDEYKYKSCIRQTEYVTISKIYSTKESQNG